MAGSFTFHEWKKIFKLLETKGKEFGLPTRRKKSAILGSFNIRKLGALKNSRKKSARSKGAWDFLSLVAGRFDLLAVQEVQDSLEGISRLRDLLGKNYGLVVSDTTGKQPGGTGMAERLAFLFNWKRVRRTEVASDITYDRSTVAHNLFTNRKRFWAAFKEYGGKLETWEAECALRKAQNIKKKPDKPTMRLPEFLTFIRQPHCASFELGGAKPYSLLAVNAHLLYGEFPEERRMEFFAILEWLVARAKKPDVMYHPNILFMGDCNLEFKDPDKERPEIEAKIKEINSSRLKSRKAAKFNFPFLDIHPERAEVFRTAARQKDTYDQIGLIFNDKRLPDYTKNREAGKNGADGYDFGVFNFVELFCRALYGKSFSALTKKEIKTFFAKFEHDVSDHMPLWIRLPIPE